MTEAIADFVEDDALDHFGAREHSPYRFFTAETWAKFRADTPLTLSEDEVQRLRSMNDRLPTWPP